MKRRFPGEQNGPRGHAPVVPGAPQRPHDPRFPGRGGNGPPQMQRGPPPGRFQGRGGQRAPGGFMPGRGPGPGLGGRGPPIMGGRGPPHGMHGRGPPMREPMGRGMLHHPIGGRGNPGRGGMGDRGPLPGRLPPPMGRGRMGPGPPIPPGLPQPIPPPPPRGPGGLPQQMRGPPPPQHVPLPRGGPPPGIPPPPIRQGFPGHQPQAGLATNVNPVVPPPFNVQTLSQPTGVVGPPRVGVGPQHHFQPNNVQQVHAQPVHSGQPPQVAKTYPTIAAPVAPGQIGNQSNQVVGALPTQVAAQPSSYTKDQIEAAWKEYDGPNGVKYYHNSITKESTYTKPDVLARKDASTKTATNGAQWKEYEDANTGKKYYSNGVTTTWEKPAGFQSDTSSLAEEPEQPAKKKKKASTNKESEFANRAEAIAAFKGLLLAKAIAPTLKWNEVVKLCSSDSRWAACEDTLSVGERRQAMAEYQTKRANEIRDQERQERIRAKEAFGQLLTEVLPSVTGFSAWNSRFPEVRASLSKDDRFYAVEDEETRESLFLDFCEEFRKRDERKKRSRKREAQDAFLALLGEKEEAGSLTFASTWDSFLSSLDDNDKKDPRLETSIAMSDSDRQLYFADFVIELQAAEDEKRRRIRDARRRAEKAQREAYRELLRKMASDGRITPYTRWRSVQDTIAVDESFKLVEAQDRDSPRDLFEEFLDEWNEGYRRERSFLNRLMSSGRKEIRVKAGTTFEQFTKLLLDEAAYSPDVYGDVRRIINREQPISSARLFYDEVIARTREGRQTKDDSSEDEGEIIEDGEVSESAVEEPSKTELGNTIDSGTGSSIKGTSMEDESRGAIHESQASSGTETKENPAGEHEAPAGESLADKQPIGDKEGHEKSAVDSREAPAS